MAEEQQKCPKCKAGAPAWMVSFADLMTLLFATFVVLYGLKKDGIGDAVRVLTATASIRESFNETQQTIPESRRKSPLMEGKTVFDYFKKDQLTPKVLKKFRRQEHVMNIMSRQMIQVKELIKEETKENKAAADITVHKIADGFKIHVLDARFYEPGQYRIKRENLPTLKRIGELLKEFGRNVTVEGHTDSIPPSTGMSNWELSTFRATYVLRYFIRELNFPPDMITSSGYADTKPFADNKTAKGRRLNRRVEIKVQYEDKETNPY